MKLTLDDIEFTPGEPELNLLAAEIRQLKDDVSYLKKRICVLEAGEQPV